MLLLHLAMRPKSGAGRITVPLEARQLAEKHANKTVAVSFGSPYILRELGDVQREELGETYSVSVGLAQPTPQRGAGHIEIGFSAAPDNVDKMITRVQQEVTRLQKELATTAIYVTHDQVEAMTMADRIVVLNAGRVEQYGSPLELYERPANLFVAGFIGSPKMNFVSGPPASRHNAATIGIRPEHLRIAREGEGESWPGTVSVAEHLGSDTFLYVDAGALGLLTVRGIGEIHLKSGDRVFLSPDPARLHSFDKDGKAIRQ